MSTKQEMENVAKKAEEFTVNEDFINNVPLADWGTTYRPDPAHITDFLGADAHNNTTPAAAPEWVSLPMQGGVPPSNHWGETVKDDRDLYNMRTDLVRLAAAGGSNPTASGPVSTSLEDMDYDPESETGDVIPDRDKPNIDEEVPPVEPEEPPVEPEPEEPPVEPETDQNLPPLP